ncbi:hypothetical protein VB264_11490 [Arcicella aquatica]|uniref:Uncharacterized protein n=1 Tax=Arcicella aquatica TaxID=217141 RepID=A0ABU5QMW7_9BACT|nr:hypothetical protein [Arcicella aquatica]MEA5258406.1 hypothetical protein [Arcicella aquatica]
MLPLFAADLYQYGYNLVRNKQVVEDCLGHILNDKDANKLWAGEYDKGLEIKV